MNNQLDTLKQTALSLGNTKSNANNAKSLANTLIGQALYIIKAGSLQERVALQRYVAKDAEGFAYRQYVSKAKTIVEHFASVDEVTMKDGATVSKETIDNGSFDNLPSLTFTSVYNAIKAETKEFVSTETREKQALALGMEAEGLSKSDLKALSKDDVARITQVGEAILSQQDAKAHLDGLASVKHAIEAMSTAERNALVDFIASLEAAENAAQAA